MYGHFWSVMVTWQAYELILIIQYCQCLLIMYPLCLLTSHDCGPAANLDFAVFRLSSIPSNTI